jgi:membrane protein DedA with SNARE-associated domain
VITAIRKFPRARRIAIAVIVAVIVPTVLFGLRTYNSFLLLRSAYEAGAPSTSSIRPWMTLRYLATHYRVPAARLIARLELPPSTDPDTSIRSLAEGHGLSPFEYIRKVQLAVANATPPDAPQPREEKSGWLAGIGDELLSALLVYGYPVLALILLFGAIGLPVPTGLSVTLAGSLTALGRMEWLLAAAIAVGASILGDAIGYGLGRLLGQHFLERHGRWLGYTHGRHVRVQALFDRWGAWTILVTRTLASHLSSVVSLLAGLARQRLAVFLFFDAVGRVLWTSAYFALGYTIGGNLDAATAFLTNLSILLALLMLLAAAGAVASGRLFNEPGS